MDSSRSISLYGGAKRSNKRSSKSIRKGSKKSSKRTSMRKTTSKKMKGGARRSHKRSSKSKKLVRKGSKKGSKRMSGGARRRRSSKKGTKKSSKRSRKMKGGNPTPMEAATALIQPRIKSAKALGEINMIINEPEIKAAIQANGCGHDELSKNIQRLMRIVDGDIGDLQFLGDTKANIKKNLQRPTPQNPTKSYIINLGGIRDRVEQLIDAAKLP